MRCIAWKRNVLQASGNLERDVLQMNFFSLCAHLLFLTLRLKAVLIVLHQKIIIKTPYFHPSQDMVILLFKTPKQTYRVHLFQNFKVKFGCPLLTTLLYLSTFVSRKKN